MPGVSFLYIAQGTHDMTGEVGDAYVGLDRFGRVAEHRWVGGSGALAIDIDRYHDVDDRDSNPLGRENVLLPGYSGRYTYGEINRLSEFKRGTVSFSGSALSTTGTLSTQTRSLDALGNWIRTVEGAFGTGSRTNDLQNQLTGLASTATGSVTLNYDPNGNQVTDEDGNALTYDAWNRLATWTNSANTLKITYTYDAMGRRISRTETAISGGTPTTSTTTRFTYSDQWQVLAEWNAAGAINYSYVWSPVYVDAMVLRDHVDFTSSPVGDYNKDGIVNSADYTVWADHFGQTGSNIPGDGNADGTVDASDFTVWADHFGEVASLKYFARVYARQDANYNVTSIVAASGTGTITWSTAERYEQDAYGGNLTVMNASFVTQGTGFAASGLGWSHYHQGGRADAVTALMSFRMREYDPNQGRWVQEDPAGYVDGGDLYQFVKSAPTQWVDPRGLQQWKPKLIYGQYFLHDATYFSDNGTFAEDWFKFQAKATPTDTSLTIVAEAKGYIDYVLAWREANPVLSTIADIDCTDEGTPFSVRSGESSKTDQFVQVATAMSETLEGRILRIDVASSAAMSAKGGPTIKVGGKNGDIGADITFSWPQNDFQSTQPLKTYKWKCSCGK